LNTVARVGRSTPRPLAPLPVIKDRTADIGPLAWLVAADEEAEVETPPSFSMRGATCRMFWGRFDGT
jgi:hypothetical protein